MAYIIKSKEEHLKSIERCKAKARRRAEQQLDVMDCALSSWADSSYSQFDNHAIACLEMGEELGIDGPADDKWFLVDNSGKKPRDVGAKLIKGQYGMVWILNDEEEKKYGRKFVPEGEKSRIQKELNLSEVQRLTPCMRVVGANCAFVGGPMSFFSLFDEVEVAKEEASY